MLYEVKSTLESGFTVRATSGKHEVVLDMREAAGGADLGMTPVQMVLAGIVGCQLMTARSYANKHKLNVTDIDATASCETKDLKVDGRLNFKVTLTVKGELDDQQKKSLEKYVEKNCTVTVLLAVANDIEMTMRYEES